MMSSSEQKTASFCACGVEICRWQNRCHDCRVKAVIAAAKTVEPSAPLHIADSDDTFYFDLSEAAEFAAGQYAHPCDEEPLRLNAKRVAACLAERAVEDMCEEAFEDAADYVKGEEELRQAFEAALETFNSAQNSSSWIPRTNEVFVIPASADTHPKDGDSTEIEAPLVSGAVPKADAQND
jgi:hypothetical protein